MSHPLTTIERAFEIARSGAVRTVGEIERVLKGEQFMDVAGMLQGPAIRRQLRQLLLEAHYHPGAKP